MAITRERIGHGMKRKEESILTIGMKRYQSVLRNRVENEKEWTLRFCDAIV